MSDKNVKITKYTRKFKLLIYRVFSRYKILLFNLKFKLHLIDILYIDTKKHFFSVFF